MHKKIKSIYYVMYGHGVRLAERLNSQSVTDWGFSQSLSIQWSILSKFYHRKRKFSILIRQQILLSLAQILIDYSRERWHTLGISDVFHSFLHDDVAELAGHPEGQHPQTGFFTFITHLLLGFGRLEIQGRMMMCSVCVWRLCLALSQYNRMKLNRFLRA